MSETPLSLYLLSYEGMFRCLESSIELFRYLFWETAILVVAIYTVLGFVMFIISRNIKLIFLPFLYAILGGITGVVSGAILCMEHIESIDF